MELPFGLKWNVRKKNSMECSMLFWINPESSTLQNNSCTYFLSHARDCWRSKDELISDFLLWILTHEHINVSWPAKTYIHQVCEVTGCRLEDLPKVRTYRDERWTSERESERVREREIERVKRTCAVIITWWWRESYERYKSKNTTSLVFN